MPTDVRRRANNKWDAAIAWAVETAESFFEISAHNYSAGRNSGVFSLSSAGQTPISGRSKDRKTKQTEVLTHDKRSNHSG